MLHSILSASAATEDTSKTVAQQTVGGAGGVVASEPSQAISIIQGR